MACCKQPPPQSYMLVDNQRHISLLLYYPRLPTKDNVWLLNCYSFKSQTEMVRFLCPVLTFRRFVKLQVSARGLFFTFLLGSLMSSQEHLGEPLEFETSITLSSITLLQNDGQVNMCWAHCRLLRTVVFYIKVTVYTTVRVLATDKQDLGAITSNHDKQAMTPIRDSNLCEVCKPTN